jgi:hypothetical protein
VVDFGSRSDEVGGKVQTSTAPVEIRIDFTGLIRWLECWYEVGIILEKESRPESWVALTGG